MRTPAERFRTLAPLAALTVASIALLTSTSGTLAAWTDDEYVSAGAGVMVAGDCTTTTLFQTESAGRQLSGSLGGADLDTLAAVQGVQVGNANGTVTVTPATATQVDPVTYTSALEAGALGTPLLSAAVGLNQPAGNAGAYTQWAQAKASGQAAGAAGLVSDQSGAIDGTGTAAGSTTAPTVASVNLASFVPSSAAAMTLDVGAVASSAAVDACTLTNGWPTLDPSPTVNRSYGIAGLRLNLSAGSIQTMTSSVAATLDGLSQKLADAAAPNGPLTAAVKAGVTGLVLPDSGLTVGSATTETTFGAPDLSVARQLLTTPPTDGVVTIDLVNARIYFDLAKLAYGPAGLNGLDPNTRVAFDAASAQILTQRTSALLEAWREAVTAEVEKALAATAFTMETTLLLRAKNGLLGTIDVAEVTLRYDTTVGAFLPQTPPVPLPAPTVSTAILGLGLPGQELLGSVTAALASGTGAVVAGALEDALFGPGALVPAAAGAIQSAALPVTAAAESALTPLADTLSLTVNVQPDQPGAPVGAGAAGSAADGQYKVSALRIAAVGSTAEIYLATAAAGPIVFRPGAG
jgi:hypothetical protein